MTRYAADTSVSVPSTRGSYAGPQSEGPAPGGRRAPRRAAAAAAGGGRRAVSDRFEDRLRTRAVDCRHPLGPGPRVGVPLSPDEADCTADLVAAVREVIEWKSEGGHRELDVPTQAMADRLTALDEASGRG